MNSTTSLSPGNLLLGQLPPREQKRLQSHLELVSVEARQELGGVGSNLRYICFPLDCAISLLDHQSSGRSVEIAVIGKEGSMLMVSASGTAVKLG